MLRVKNHLSWCDKSKLIWLCFIFLSFNTTCNEVLADAENRSHPSEIEREVLELINIERQKNSLPPFTWDTQLYDATRGHSEDMAAQNYFSHTSLSAREVIDRVRQAGYDAASVSENIGAGQSSAQQIFRDWMVHNGVKGNILSETHCDAAVSHATNEESDWTGYWTLNLGRKNGVDQCPTIEPEPEVEPEPEEDPIAEPVSTNDELGFCEELIQRHSNFCRKHPDLCRAALNKCKRSQDY